MKSLLQIGQKKAFQIFKNVLGNSFFQELSELLTGLQPLYKALQTTALDMQSILSSDQTKGILISSLEDYPLQETLRIHQSLKSKNLLPNRQLILNRTLSAKHPLPTH